MPEGRTLEEVIASRGDRFTGEDPTIARNPTLKDLINIDPSIRQEANRKYISPIIRGTMVNAGTVGGGALGLRGGRPLVGAALGGTGMDQIFQQLQRSNPQLLGTPPKSMLESLASSGMNALLDMSMTKLLSHAEPSLLSKIFPTRASKEQMAGMLEEGHGLPLDVQDVTQGPLPGFLKEVFGGRPKGEAELRQQTHLKGQIYRLINDLADVSGDITEGKSKEIAERSYGKTIAISNTYKAMEKRAWDLLEKNLLPMQKVAGFEAPIWLRTTAKASEQFKAYLVKQSKTLDLPADLKGEITKTLKNLEMFDSAKFTHTNGAQIVNYAEAKFLRDNLASFSTMAKERGESKLGDQIEKFLDGAIRKDINTSIASYGPHFKAVHETAKQLTKINYSRYLKKGTPGHAMLDESTVKETVLNNALKTAEQATEFVKMSGSNEELGEHFIRKVFKDTYQDETGFFHPETGLKYLRENDEVATVALGPEFKARTKHILERMSAVDPRLSKMGKTAFYIRAGSAMATIPAGLYSLANRDEIPQGLLVGGGLVAAVPLTILFTRKMIMNPQTGNALLKVFQQGSNAETTAATKLILAGLTEARIYVQYNNQSYPATVKEGKVVLDPPTPQTQSKWEQLANPIGM